MSQSSVNWLSVSVVLPRLLSPNQCEILEFQKRANELCNPCTVLFVLFIDLPIQHCWKTVLINSINVSFNYQSPLTLYFVLCFIRFHADKLHLFYSKHLFYFWRKAQDANNDLWSSTTTVKFENAVWGVTAPFFHYIVQHYYISHVLHALIWHKNKALHNGYGFKAMTDDGQCLMWFSQCKWTNNKTNVFVAWVLISFLSAVSFGRIWAYQGGVKLKKLKVFLRRGKS